MKTTRCLLLAAMLPVLAGCPVSTSITVHNASSVQVTLVSSRSKPFLLGSGMSVTIYGDGFLLDRNANGVEELRIEAKTFQACGALDFRSMKLRDGELGRGDHRIIEFLIDDSGRLLFLGNPTRQDGHAAGMEARPFREMPACANK